MEGEKKGRVSRASVVQLPSNAPCGPVVTRHKISQRPICWSHTYIYHRQIKYDTIAAWFVATSCAVNTRSLDTAKKKHPSRGEYRISVCVLYEVAAFPRAISQPYSTGDTHHLDEGPGWICNPSPPLPRFLSLSRSIDVQSSWQMFQSPGIKNEPEVIDRLHGEGYNILNGPSYCKWQANHNKIYCKLRAVKSD